LAAASSNRRSDSLVAACVQDHFVERETLIEKDEEVLCKPGKADRLPTCERVM
jgi:hypothetical protein